MSDVSFKNEYIINQINSCKQETRYTIVNLIIAEIGREQLTQNKDGVSLFIDVIPSHLIETIYQIVKKAVEDDTLKLDD